MNAKNRALTQSAPETIYLQVGQDAEIYPSDHDGVSWCWHDVHGNDVKYLRADLAHIGLFQGDEIFEGCVTSLQLKDYLKQQDAPSRL